MMFGLYIALSYALPGRERVVPYSIQTLKRLKPSMFRQDLMSLLELLEQRQIKPIVSHRLSLAEAKRAHDLLGQGGVTGKIVLLCAVPQAASSLPGALPAQGVHHPSNATA